MAGKYDICLDIGGTKVLGVLFDKKKNIVARTKKKSKVFGDDATDVEKVITAVVDDMLKENNLKISDISAISAGMPGVVDSAAGVVIFTPNLPFRDYDLASVMSKKYGVPFYIGNDVNLGVLGEHRYGAAMGKKYVVGLFPGTGMGGGIIVDGELYTGYGFKGAEIGHMIVQADGPKCGCGQRGCLEAFSSKKGMSSYIIEQTERGRTSYMSDKIVNGVFKSSVLKKAIARNDEVALEAVNRACHWMAVATGSLINIFSPEVVVYGGGVMEAVGDIFMEKIEAQVDRYCMPSIRSTVELKKADLGDYSNIYGALALIEDARK